MVLKVLNCHVMKNLAIQAEAGRGVRHRTALGTADQLAQIGFTRQAKLYVAAFRRAGE
jgi:hypothetical protein